jgi:hypothetical protein
MDTIAGFDDKWHKVCTYRIHTYVNLETGAGANDFKCSRDERLNVPS